MQHLISLLAGLGITVALGACASTDTAPSGQAPAASSVACNQERPTGSNIAVNKCRAPEQVKQ